MSTSKAATRQASTEQGIPYTIGVCIIGLSVFGANLYMNWTTSAIAAGAMSAQEIVISVAIFLVFSFLLLQMEATGDLNLGFNKYQILHKSLSKSNRYLPILVNKSLLNTTYYYPGLNTQVTPLFGIPAFINFRAILFVVPYSIATMLLMDDLLLVAKLTVIAFVCCWLFLVALNLKPIFNILAHRGREELRAVNFHYSLKSMTKMLKEQVIIYNKDEDTDKEQVIIYNKDEDTDKDLLELLYRSGDSAGREINNLIASKYITAAMLDNEIKTIEHVINYFVPTAINTTKEFFDKHSNKRDAAMTIYMRDVSPKVSKEARELYNHIHTIDKTIWHIKNAQRDIEMAKIEEQRIIDEGSIKINMDLLTLTEKTILPVNEFPEFHELRFNSVKKQVAAQNIVSGSLRELVEAKNKALTSTDIDNLNAQIKRVKIFVKSLASDTPESAAREARIINKEKNSALYLENNAISVKDIDHMIAVNERYIESYDNILPISD